MPIFPFLSFCLSLSSAILSSPVFLQLEVHRDLFGVVS